MAALQRKITRTTGLFYLGLALAGAAGFLFLRPRLFVEGDAAATVANLAAHPSAARLMVVFELLVVLTQALAAGWFYRLFRPVDPTAAAGIAAFGLVNAVAVMVSAALLGTALQIGVLPTTALGPDDVQLMFLISGNLWEVGGLFFGLWLIPMGWCVLRAGSMPRALGWILIAGGAGYVASTLLTFGVPGAGLLANALVVPASIGEFWMIGYLLIRGVRAPEAVPQPS